MEFKDLTNGQMRAIVQKLGGADAALQFLRGELAVRTVKTALKNPKLVSEEISVVTGAFSRESFFWKSERAKIHIGDDFRNFVLSAIPEEAPGVTCSLLKHELTKPMSDSEILSELCNPQPFTPEIFAAVVNYLITRQSDGRNGALLTNGHANIFYVQLADGRVVSVFVRWNDGGGDWSFSAGGLGDYGWLGGSCVFSRS